MNTNKILFKTHLREVDKFVSIYLIDKIFDKITVAASLFTGLQIRESIIKIDYKIKTRPSVLQLTRNYIEGNSQNIGVLQNIVLCCLCV